MANIRPFVLEIKFEALNYEGVFCLLRDVWRSNDDLEQISLHASIVTHCNDSIKVQVFVSFD